MVPQSVRKNGHAPAGSPTVQTCQLEKNTHDQEALRSDCLRKPDHFRDFFTDVSAVVVATSAVGVEGAGGVNGVGSVVEVVAAVVVGLVVDSSNAMRLLVKLRDRVGRTSCGPRRCSFPFLGPDDGPCSHADLTQINLVLIDTW
jgi:hypothetical protein